MNTLKSVKIAIIGLGYVGLPLAVAFARVFQTTGYDINAKRIAELRDGVDATLEVDSSDLNATDALQFTTDVDDIADCNVYIITVPTPIDMHKQPDLKPLYQASELVGQVISKGDTVIYESTVYPGATEEECIPIIERVSGLTFNIDFFAGYSPERINPGDKTHRLETIVKVTSGSTPAAAKFVDNLYREIIDAGTHMAPTIKVAEAAKVIENTQRDLNIALVNELAIIFNKLGIDTLDVLEAAGTKWNFLPFRPGLVGGHCIGVDPYYLTHKAQSVGYHPEVVLAGRKINDGMAQHIVQQMLHAMILKSIPIKESRILIMGLTFKENCPDLRNTRVVDIISALEDYGILTDVYDPWINVDAAQKEYGINVVERPEKGAYDGTILAVGHDDFKSIDMAAFKEMMKPVNVVYDIKGFLTCIAPDLRL